MPATTVNPGDSRHFDGRANGYIIRVSKVVWNHVVRYIAKAGDHIIDEGTVPVGIPYREFLVHPNTAFDIINVGTWDMDVAWPGNIAAITNEKTELDQVISNLPYADFELGVGVDAITGGMAGTAVTTFTPKECTGKRSSEHFRFIQSESELNREIEASASGKYNIEGIKVSASTSYLSKIKYSELSITLIAEYEVVCSHYDDVDTYTLTEQAQKLIGEPEKFRKAYGDYFVAGGKRSARFVAIYNCQSTTVKSMDEFKASFGGEAPDVFSAEGSARFMQSTSKNNISTALDLFMEGYKGTSPSGPWTPDKIMEALTWFKANEQGIPLQAKLKHYSTIDPAYPRTIDVAPSVFVELSQIYAKVWDIRSRYGSCPTYYQDQFKTEYRDLDYGVVASQHILASDLSKRQEYQQKADILLSNLDDVFARMDFYLKVKNVVDTEPAENHSIEEGAGQQTWMYGFNVYTKSGAVNIHQSVQTYKELWHVGRREHTFEFGPDGKFLIVGWQVISNWNDGSNGSWYKAIDRILLTDHSAVHVTSQYDRGCDWSLIVYYVDAKEYQF